MPAKLDRCVKSVMNRGKSKGGAFAICISSLKKKGKKKFTHKKKK